MTTRSWRRSLVLFVVTFVLLVAAGPLLYITTVLNDEDAFVALSDRALAHPDVRDAVAEVTATVTIDVVTTDETITAALPGEVRTLAVPLTQLAADQLADAAFRLLDTDVAVDARSTALREVHRQFSEDEEEITIDLRAVLVRTSRELGGPAVGAAVAKFVVDEDIGRFTLAEADSANGWLLTVVQAVPAVAGVLALLALVTLAAGVLVAPDRWAALGSGGLVVAGAAVVSSLLVGIGLYLVLGSTAEGSPVAVAVADIIASDYAQYQQGLVLNGLVLAGIGLLLGQRPSAVALRALPGDLWHRRPGALNQAAIVVVDNPPAARLVGWLVACFALVSWSTPTWRVVLTILLLSLGYQVLVWVFSSRHPRAAEARSRFKFDDLPVDGGSEPGGRSRVRTNLLVMLAVGFLLWPGWSLRLVTVFLITAFAVLALLDIGPARRLRDETEVEAETLGVSGTRTGGGAGIVGSDLVAAAVGRRRLLLAGGVAAIAVVLGIATTVSSAEKAEAAAGCNGHVELCDRRVDEVVFAGSHNAMSSTALGWELAMQDGDMVAQLDHGIRALLIDALYWQDEGQLDGGSSGATEVIESALSDDAPRPGTWLCHGFCALGATDLTAGLAAIDSWLTENPRDVLLIIVQDEVSFDDLEAAFVASGLRDRTHAHSPGTPFPTLEELIDSGERILVYGENGGEPGTWFQNGYADSFVETPFTFDVRTDFSCVPNRGGDDNPLFLINHWLTTGIPVREAAAIVNSRDVLRERLLDCEVERGRTPTILAVDFAETGDLIDVVDELNGIG